MHGLGESDKQLSYVYRRTLVTFSSIGAIRYSVKIIPIFLA